MSVQPTMEDQRDGNAIRAGIKMKNELTEKLLGPQGLFTKLFTIIDVHLLVFVIGLQSSLLNYYILKYNSMNVYYYSLFATDAITVCTFVWSIVMAKKYFELQDKIENPTYYADGIDCNPDNNLGHRVLFCTLPRKLGVLPFIYICWLIYTVSLISKILIIFLTDVPNHMLNENFKIGPQTVLMSLALTSIIFLLYMYAHRNSENDYHRDITKSWIEDMTSHTVFEIFDSILFLDLVLPERDHHHDHNVRHEVRETISPYLEYTIISLACANFLIPTINLYHLSQLSACKLNTCKNIDLKGKFRHIIIHFIRLFSVNIAYLVVRVYVSNTYEKAMTIFIIKNVLCIIMSFRSLFIEINDYFSTKKQLRESSNGISKKGDHMDNAHAYELQNLSANINDKLTQNNSQNAFVNGNKDLPNVDDFEDVSLK